MLGAIWYRLWTGFMLFRVFLTSSEVPLLTRSYLMAPGLMASMRSMTGMLVVMAASLNPEMLLDLPASARVVFVHSTISESLIGLEDPASF